MVKTKEALLASALSAAGVGLVYYVASHYWFNNPALVESNKTLVMYVVVAAVFIIGFVGMKWKEWFK